MVPKFDPKTQRFDQSTFMGRLSKMLLACDPSLLFCSDGEVKRCKEMVDDYERLLKELPDGVSETEMSRKLWEAQRVASAALHPDSGDSIPHPFRMSGYVPFNGPICVSMVASQSTSALLFWSWVNQSQNALVNYYNRNASSEMTNETLAVSYAAAVGSALTVAFGLATFIQRRYSPAQAKNLMKWVAFPSAVVASSLNCYIVRSPEIDTGVPLVDSDGNEVLPNETSTIAAERGVNSTTLSRALLQAPVYFFPPFLMGSIPVLKNALVRNPMLRVPMTTYLLLVCFGIGLPCSVAIFPQMGEIKVNEAEEKYHNLPDKTNGGRPYEVLYYNKGL
ncbi:sideroflexin 5 [Thalassiosira pseudonana CCMP1335]|uniref:Sideroflexin 5 n=1 Tax=Thalassiosira pseudonana TaxID=35128 RepID=B8C674_THAPS|nr:sideroflexin 5 [Thalassiosira pseudonana CCMP1335]EED91246.1 sideroflexin 5 [Thalassiosira pseudonana CCMP1335]